MTLTKLTNLAGPAGAPGTIPTEAAIAEALDGQLVRDAFGEAMSEELADTSSPVRTSVDQRITAGIASSVATEVTAQNASLWTPNRRRVGVQTDCVIVGSSNATSGTWGTEFCATWGLTQRNFALGGTGFNSAQNFLSQLQSAAADPSFANSNVALVVICDASNNIRQWNDAGSTVSVATDAAAAFSYARATFPRARVVCIPVVWPADPVANVTGVPGGYQGAWGRGLTTIVDQIQVAALANNVEVVDQSWTWLSGLTGIMNSDGSVHPNAAGYTLIAQWLSRHLRGESTRKDTAWEAMSYVGGSTAIAGSAPLRWRREGWTVFVNGTAKIGTLGSGGATDFATLKAGVRPPQGWEIQARQNGTATVTGVQLFTVGNVRIPANIAAGVEYFVSGTFSLS